jgi:hypothetical protein
MTKEIFADAIGRVDLVAGVVRIEIVSVEPPPEGGTQGQPVVRQRVIMPLEGFIGSLDTLADFAKKLEAAGIIKRNPAAAAPQSPNFN